MRGVSLAAADIVGSESGSNKQVASKACALSVVRQLFHLGVIPAYSGDKSMKKKDAQVTICLRPASGVAGFECSDAEAKKELLVFNNFVTVIIVKVLFVFYLTTQRRK